MAESENSLDRCVQAKGRDSSAIYTAEIYSEMGGGRGLVGEICFWQSVNRARLVPVVK